MGAFTIVRGDPALIRSDNTVRNGISTIGLQSLSSQSKGLLKHSAAQLCSLSLPLFIFCFSSSIDLLFLHLFLFAALVFSTISVFLSLSIPPDSPHPSFVEEKGEHEYHTQTVSRPLHSNITAARFFPSQVNDSTSFFSLHRKQW